MIDNLLQHLINKKLKFESLEKNNEAVILTFEVWAKPGSKFEKVFISTEGVLIIQTRSKPIDGEANQAIVEVVSSLFGVQKSSVEIIRGEKSRQKRIKLLLEITASKNQSYYQKKISEISIQEV